MTQKQSNWDWKILSDKYLYIAQDTERYLNEVREKLKTNDNYKIIFDENLAKYYVYNYLHGRTFLQSREEFVNELNNLLERQFDAPPEAFDKERFLNSRRMFLNGILSSINK